MRFLFLAFLLLSAPLFATTATYKSQISEMKPNEEKTLALEVAKQYEAFIDEKDADDKYEYAQDTKEAVTVFMKKYQCSRVASAVQAIEKEVDEYLSTHEEPSKFLGIF